MKIINNTQIEGTRNELIEYFKNELIKDLKLNTNHKIICDDIERTYVAISKLMDLGGNHYVSMTFMINGVWDIQEDKLVKFEESDDGLVYVGNHGVYELLEGIASNGLSSDMIFLVKRVINEDDVEIVSKTKILDFLYGGFSSDNIEYFERLIEQHEIECDNIEKREKPLF